MGEKKCSSYACNLDTYIDGKCILHCAKKHLYDYKERQFFYDVLSKIVEDNGSELIVLNYIIFPEHDERYDDSYEKILKTLKSIQFNYCEFHTSNLDLPEIQCFFQDCKFHKYWTLYDYKVLKNKDDVIYQCCTFMEDVSVYSAEDKGILFPIFHESQFDYGCTFKGEVRFDDTKIKKPLFNTNQNSYSSTPLFMQSLIFHNCTFEQPFKLNNYKIDYFSCNHTVFKNKSKFEFKNNEVKEFQLLDTNFKSLVDCMETEFQSFKVEKSIFEKFTGFEKCKFGEKEKNSKEAIFQYATFLDFVNFRDAEFHSGLDLRNANFKESPNFLDVKVEPNNKVKKTNKETFRMIKHSFDKVGNTIEANKYFAYEMNEERKESRGFKKFMLNLNYLISDFGQSWIMPLFWIVVVAGLHYYITDVNHEWLQSFAPTDIKLKTKLLDVINAFDSFAKNILPFKKFLKEGMEFISLLFLIIYSTLIYNLIIAVKRITKR